MLSKILHRIVANPQVYDWVQALAGANQVKRRLAAQFASCCPSAPFVVLDVGGGTGFYRDAVPRSGSYVCLDIDSRKLEGFLAKHPEDQVLLADGVRAPLKNESVDIVLCTMVTHHIPNSQLKQFITESARLLKSAGKLVLVDPVWAPRRWTGRLLWKYDRGSYPRTADALETIISDRYTVDHWDRFAIYHEYMLCVATKQPQEVGNGPLATARIGSDP